MGSIGLHLQNDIYRKNAELGYWLAEPFWNYGIMSKAISEVVHFGFKNYDIERIFARPFGTNIASQKCLEKCGFSLEAKLRNTLFKNGQYIDEMIYAIRKSK
ncbi:MAG: GNAT family protein [Bacteroidota bacterium]